VPGKRNSHLSPQSSPPAPATLLVRGTRGAWASQRSAWRPQRPCGGPNQPSARAGPPQPWSGRWAPPGPAQGAARPGLARQTNARIVARRVLAKWLCNARFGAAVFHQGALETGPSGAVLSLRTHVPFSEDICTRAARARRPAAHPLVPSARGRPRGRLGGRRERANQVRRDAPDAAAWCRSDEEDREAPGAAGSGTAGVHGGA